MSSDFFRQYYVEIYMGSNAGRPILVAMFLAAGLSACGDSKEAAAPAATQASSAPAAKQEAPKDTWKDYAFADGGFTVKVPSDPTCQQQEAAKGIMATMCTTENEKTGMMISATKLPGAVPPGNIDNAIAGGMAGSAKNMQGELVNPVDVTVGGVKGKDFSVKTAQGEVRSRIFIKGNYLIQVMGMPKGELDASKAEIEKFVTSLSPKAGS
jgi:hypothetical protein